MKIRENLFKVGILTIIVNHKILAYFTKKEAGVNPPPVSTTDCFYLSSIIFFDAEKSPASIR